MSAKLWAPALTACALATSIALVGCSKDPKGAEQAAAAKFWVTELQNRVVDKCLQLHGGYGYMLEYPIARAWADSRIQTIYGGTTEIMKEIVGRSLTK